MPYFGVKLSCVYLMFAYRKIKREKIKTVYSKMKDEVKNCDLDSESSKRHNDCCFMLPHLEDQIEKWIKTNDKDEFLEVIEEFITEFDGMLQEV